MRQIVLLLALCPLLSLAQETPPGKWSAGLAYGYGEEFKNRDYSYANHYLQAQLYYSFNPGKKWEFQVAVQPEVNFAKHQLLNLYFVTPDVPDYEEKRAEYTKLKDIREYVLNVAGFVRRNVTEDFSLYFMANVGPMVTDTETERLSKGFAFCDVFALGATYQVGDVMLDLRPNWRHTSNAGLKDSNAGFNTFNVSLGLRMAL